MGYSQYIANTMMVSFGKLIPLVVTIGLGYVIFFKLPFLLFRKTIVAAKQQTPDVILVETPKVEEKAKPREQKKEAPPKKKPEPVFNAEALFNFKPGEVITKSELKKRYFELLKASHPDKVASLDEEFKNLADKRTKAINTAYEKLKSKAA